MPAERLSMRKVREVLHLKHALGMSYRKISGATGAGKTQAAEYVRRAQAAGITWPVPEGIDDAELERRLFPVADDSATRRPAIDWPAIQRELKRRGVTLALLWQEYLAEHANGYSYTRFCELYGEWRKHLSATMRQTHVAGEKLFVDWAGDTIGVVDPATGEVRNARIFVAALGRIELHVRRGALDGDAVRLDRCARQRVRGDRRRAAGACAGQSQGRYHQAVALRAGHQSHLPGSRRSLRLRGAADADRTPARQGQGRSRRADRRALRAGEAAATARSSRSRS